MKETSLRQKITLIVFGLFLCAVLLEIGLRIGGFVILSLQEYRNWRSVRQGGECRILCLGESTTALYSHNYPTQLEKLLNEKDIGVKFSVINKGRAGTNTRLILSSLQDNLDRYDPDIVVTMMGINDGAYVRYEDIADKKEILPFRSLRVYKLLDALRVHIANKIGELKVRDSDDFVKQEDKLKENVETEPEDYEAYIQLASFYEAEGKYGKSEEAFEKAIEMEPENSRGYFELGWTYRQQSEEDKAEEMFRKAIDINPHHYRAYTALSLFDELQERYSKDEEEVVRKSIEAIPDGYEACFTLGEWHRQDGSFLEAEEVFKKLINVYPENYRAYFALSDCYIEEGKDGKARDILEKAVEILPEDNETAYGVLAHIYNQLEEYALAEEYFQKANKATLKYFSSTMRHNYRKLKEILAQKGIKLVCVQYPVRSVEPLKKILEPHDGVVFVDNESSFKEAISRENYGEYFVDMFAGDFGHCTAKGNRLLAENVANTILKEYFNK